MFVRTLHPFGKSPSRPTARLRRAKALPGAGPRPQVERLEDRTLLSTVSQALVAQMYQDLLQRPADAAGLANWSAALDQGASPAQVALNLAQSPEARALQVQTLYQQFLHRGADSAGLEGFTQALAAGQTLEQVAAALVTSPEYYQNRGGGTDSGFLTALYQDALNRQVDAGGAASFGQALAGAMTRAQVAAAIFGSAELQQAMVQRDYQYFLHRAADASGLRNWTQALQQGARVEGIAAAIVGSAEYGQSVQGPGGSLQQTLLPQIGPTIPVVVTNTLTEPVPVKVTGNVGVGGPVQAQQSGPWTVGISGTPTVQVASALTNPVFVRDVNDAVQPFQTHGPFNVPAGKRLVIEDLSATAHGVGVTGGSFNVGTRVGGNFEFHSFPASFFVGFNGQGNLVAHEQVRLYADPGSIVAVGAETNVGGYTFEITFSGYYVNVP
jgi:hypothetical protein